MSLARRRSVQRLVPRFASLECWERLHDVLDHAIETSFVRNTLDHFNNFLLSLWNRHANDLLHFGILHALLNSLLRYTSNRLVRVSTIRSGTRSCGITLTFYWHINDLFHCALSTLVSLIVFSASSSVSFAHTFFHHVALNLCSLVAAAFNCSIRAF